MSDTADNGLNKADQEVAVLYGVSTRSIERLPKRCCLEGVDLALEGRCLKKRTGEVEVKLARLACRAPPAGYQHWTLQLLADSMAILIVSATPGWVTC